MNYKINSDIKFILYATAEKIEQIVPDLNKHGISPYCIIIGDTTTNMSISLSQTVYTSEKLISLNCNYPIVVCGNYYKQTKEFLKTICDINSSYACRCISDGELYRMLVLNESSEVIADTISQDSGYGGTIIDLQNGFIMGGLEVWATNLFHRMNRKGYKTKIIAINHNSKFYQNVECAFYGIDEKSTYQLDAYTSPIECINQIVNILLKENPMYFVHNGGFETLVAIYIYRTVYKNELKVFTILHSDHDWFYQYIKPFLNEIDYFVPVSEGIKQKFAKLFPSKADSMLLQIQYPEINFNLMDKIKNDNILRISYVSRLNYNTKRSHLLIELICLLEKSFPITYRLDIAGDGECFNILNQFVSSHNLENKVILHGMIPHCNMNEFWRDKHVYLSLSKLEGNSLSLLEAMSCAVVPITTSTGGVEQLIVDGKNGFIINSVDEMYEKLLLLCYNHNSYKEMAKCAQETIMYQSSKNQEFYRFLFERSSNI